MPAYVLNQLNRLAWYPPHVSQAPAHTDGPKLASAVLNKVIRTVLVLLPVLFKCSNLSNALV